MWKNLEPDNGKHMIINMNIFKEKFNIFYFCQNIFKCQIYNICATKNCIKDKYVCIWPEMEKYACSACAACAYFSQLGDSISNHREKIKGSNFFCHNMKIYV